MNEKKRSERLLAALWKVEGVTYVLRLLAAERVEESNALENQAAVLDNAFMELVTLAEEMEAEEAESEEVA